MAGALAQTLDFGARFSGESTPSAMTNALFEVLQPYGLRAIATRLYYRPSRRLDSQTLWDTGGFIANRAPAGWLGSPGHRYICLEQNPLLAAVKSGRQRFLWRDLAPHDSREFAPYWEAFSEGGLGDGMGVILHGADRRVASLSLGFSRFDLSPTEMTAVHMAGLILLDRIAETGEPAGAAPVSLSGRERDCLLLAAEGLSNGAIAEQFAIGRTTVHAHIENAKRKLGASTRAQAVARLLWQEY